MVSPFLLLSVVDYLLGPYHSLQENYSIFWSKMQENNELFRQDSSFSLA